MTVRLTSEIRETQMPVRCSACFNQQPDKRHVDFDAACDRGYSDEAAVTVVMDDLILCEDCVRVGAEKLGIEDSRELAGRVETLEKRLDVSEKRRVQAEKWAGTMEDAISHRPEKPQIDHRKRPRKLDPKETASVAG